jgi:hypothetical protein
MAASAFPFVETVAANDKTIGRLLQLANACGIEDLDWTWEWRDGGKASFKFRDEAQFTAFQWWRSYLITQILNGND